MEHLTGVQVFSEEVVKTTPVWAHALWATCILVAAIATIITLVFSKSSKNNKAIITSVVSTLLLWALAFGITVSEHAFQVYDYTQYKVYVTNECSVEEFNSTYEVIDREGKLLIVKFLEE